MNVPLCQREPTALAAQDAMVGVTGITGNESEERRWLIMEATACRYCHYNRRLSHAFPTRQRESGSVFV